MIEKFYRKDLPPIEKEINLIKAMLEVLHYEYNVAPSSNESVTKAAYEIVSNKVIELHRLINNPSTPRVDEDLINFSYVRKNK